jgi:glycosyltransferase involved in cell wall biosynthesis
MPTWKARDFVVETLDALAAQTYPNLEVLISDDASPDDTAELCERYAAGAPRFRVIRQPKNLGWLENVNALLREARGDYLVFAFQDDLFAPTYIERCVAALELRPQAILAFSDVALMEQDGSVEKLSFTALDGVSARLRRAEVMARLPAIWWTPNRGVFRARAAAEIGGLRRSRAGEFSADWPWLLHMSLLGEFVRIPEALCTKIFQPDSLSKTWSYSRRDWIAVAMSASGGVWRANIPLREKLLLVRVPAGFVARRLARAAVRSPRWLLRRLQRRTAIGVREPRADAVVLSPRAAATRRAADEESAGPV